MMIIAANYPQAAAILMYGDDRFDCSLNSSLLTSSTSLESFWWIADTVILSNVCR